MQGGKWRVRREAGMRETLEETHSGSSDEGGNDGGGKGGRSEWA